MIHFFFLFIFFINVHCAMTAVYRECYKTSTWRKKEKTLAKNSKSCWYLSIIWKTRKEERKNVSFNTPFSQWFEPLILFSWKIAVETADIFITELLLLLFVLIEFNRINRGFVNVFVFSSIWSFNHRWLILTLCLCFITFTHTQSNVL